MGNEGNFDIKQKIKVKFTFPAHPMETGACVCMEEKHFGLVYPLEDELKWETSAEASDCRCKWGAAPAVHTCSGQHV